MFALMLSASATAAPTAFGLATRGPGVPVPPLLSSPSAISRASPMPGSSTAALPLPVPPHTLRPVASPVAVPVASFSRVPRAAGIIQPCSRRPSSLRTSTGSLTRSNQRAALASSAASRRTPSSLAPGTLPALTSFIIESGACVSRTNRNMNADVASVNAPADAAAMPVIRHPRRTRPARRERNESCRCVKAAGANASQLPLRIPCADWIPSRLHGPSAAGMPGKSAKGEKSSRPLANRANGC